jgi:hypothetical protein
MPGSSGTRTPAGDAGVTRWVRDAAGLAALLAPRRSTPLPAAPAASPLPASPKQQPGTTDERANATFAAHPPSPAADVELLMDELERRLELEYLRHYGTSGR